MRSVSGRSPIHPGRWIRVSQSMGNLILLAASVTIACLALEIFLRLGMPQIFAPHPPGMYQTDPRIGYVLTPGFDGSFDRPEFHTSVHINEVGLRGPDLRPKTANTIRILALGDSFTWGWGTNADQAWPAVAKRLLSQRYPNLDIQVMNAGTPGYGTAHELAFLESKGAALQPDLVVTMFFAGNDFDDNRRTAINAYKIRDRMLVDPAPEGARAAWLRALDWLKAHSHLITLVSERAGYLAARAGILSFVEQALSEYFTTEDARRAIELLVGIANADKRLCAQSLFIFAPDKMQVLTYRTPSLRAANVVADAAHKAGVPWINLAKSMIEVTNKTELYYQEDAHWTPTGHGLAAQLIADKIAEVGLKPAEKKCQGQ